MSFVTWNDVYQELWMQAAQSRGTVTQVADPFACSKSTLPEYPRTSGADVIAIVSLVDPILHAIPLRPGGYGITRLWQAVVIEIEDHAFVNPMAEYARNGVFWSTLLVVAAYLSSMAVPLPEAEGWDAVLAALWSPADARRNAIGSDTRAVLAPTFSAMWTALRAELARIRGSDIHDDGAGGLIEVPRTIHADVVQLESYWSRPLVQLQVDVMMGSVRSPEGFEQTQLEWQIAVGRVAADAGSSNPAGTYAANVEFWRASRALAVALDLLEVRPPPYLVTDDRTSHAAPASDPRASTQSSTSKPAASDLSSRIGELTDHALNALAHVVDDASNRLVATVGKPLLFTGATLAALLLILRATASCDCGEEPAADTRVG